MNRKDLDFDKLLDRAVAEIHDDVMPDHAEQAAADRVWQRVHEEAVQMAESEPGQQRIRDCSDFQALIPAYLRGALTEAKSLLIEDHVSECLPCRKALKQARSATRAKPVQTAPASRRGAWVSTLGWRVAAAAVIFLAFVGLSFNSELLQVQAGGVIHIEDIDGELLRVTDQGTVPVAAGQQITLGKGEHLRTAKGSRAMLRLGDASAVEMKERSELAVFDRAYFWNRSNSDAVIDLERGSVIVEASDQGSGNLFVDTHDSEVAVTGTVFAVNSGIKGTRVSVIEGEVEVDTTSQQHVLHPGMQITSNSILGCVPVEEEIAWSQNFEKHLILLKEFAELSREIDEVIRPGRRYSTRLLDLSPENTVVFVGIPNVSSSLAEAHRILEEKIGSSEALRAWWNETVVPEGGDRELQNIIEKVQDYGDHLGEEVVVTLQSKTDDVSPPLLLAELKDPVAFKAFIEAEIANSPTPEKVLLVEGLRPDLSGGDADLILWIREDLLAVAFERDSILQFAAERLGGAARSADSDAAFRRQLADRYRDGVELVVGVDMETIFRDTVDAEDEQELRGLGLLDMQHLIGERRQQDDRTENRVVLTFGQERRGIAAWLDEPAPLGSLDFISPDASLAAAFVMQEPTTLVDELFSILNSLNDDFDDHLREFEAEHGINVREDVAAPLGGEFAFALDGPLLPKPSWKLVIEVYNPAQLQQTLEWALGQINQAATEAGAQGFSLASEQSGGRTFYRLESLDTGISAYYTFIDGYLVAGPSRALLLGAIQSRSNGIRLTASREFSDMLPRDAQPNFSGMIYQNLGGLLGPLVRLGSAASEITPEQQRIAEELVSYSRPSLTLAYGAKDRISFVYTHEGGFLSSGVASFFSFQSLLNMQELVGHSIHQGTQPTPDVREVDVPAESREKT